MKKTTGIYLLVNSFPSKTLQAVERRLTRLFEVIDAIILACFPSTYFAVNCTLHRVLVCCWEDREANCFELECLCSEGMAVDV